MAVRAHGWFSVFVWLSMSQSVQADTLRCGTKLVASGDATYVVRSRCGEPDDQQRRVEVRTVQRWVSAPCPTPQSKQTQCGQSTQESVEVVIEEWLYDFGPREFVQRVIFEQGRLVAVVAGARGTKQSAATVKQVSRTVSPPSLSVNDAGAAAEKRPRPWWAR